MESLGFAVGNATFPMKRYNEAEKQALALAIQKARGL
jgi:hypothetical protein